MSGTLCPCGSKRVSEQCCAPYLRGDALAPTAEALMRSRFLAYDQANQSYLLSTWHPDTRPVELAFGEASPAWTRLEIVDTQLGGPLDEGGLVEFKAHYHSGKKAGVVHERSRFVKLGGAWLYVDGDLSPSTKGTRKIGRNDPCPCHSGQKYKRCCGRGQR